MNHAEALRAKYPGLFNDTLVTRRGQRVIITLQGIQATGTVLSMTPGAVQVELDGTGQHVSVPADILSALSDLSSAE